MKDVNIKNKHTIFIARARGLAWLEHHADNVGVVSSISFLGKCVGKTKKLGKISPGPYFLFRYFRL